MYRGLWRLVAATQWVRAQASGFGYKSQWLPVSTLVSSAINCYCSCEPNWKISLNDPNGEFWLAKRSCDPNREIWFIKDLVIKLSYFIGQDHVTDSNIDPPPPAVWWCHQSGRGKCVHTLGTGASGWSWQSWWNCGGKEHLCCVCGCIVRCEMCGDGTVDEAEEGMYSIAQWASINEPHLLFVLYGVL